MSLKPPRIDVGLVLVVSGPSGVGKSTLIRHLREAIPAVDFVVSATSRAPREGEREGVDYVFVDEETFQTWVERGAFLEHARVYGNGYGTPAAAVEAAVATGRIVLLDIDAQGSALVRQADIDAAHVMILPPSKAALRDRLVHRGTDDEATVARRMAQADTQLRAAPLYDYLVVNEDLETAQAQLVGIVLAELARAGRHGAHVRSLLADT